MVEPLRILILEDNPTDTILVERELRRAGLEFVSRRVDTEAEFVAALDEFKPDIILSDYTLPSFNGMEALHLAQERAPAPPFVIVTGSLSEETAAECIKAGAADYVLKQHLDRLGPAVRRALDNARLKGERSQTQRALLDSEERLRLALAAAQMGVWEWDILTNVVFWSPECVEVLGADELDATLGSLTRLLHPEDAQRVWDAITRSHREQSSFAAEFRIVQPDGSVRWISSFARTAFDPSGTPVRMVGVVEDVTSRRAAEEELRASEQNYRTIFEEANDAMVVYEPEGEQILDVNVRACEAYGYSRDELVGTSLKRLTKHVERGEASIQQLLEEGSVRDFESVHLSRDGREINVLVNSSLIEYRGRKAVLDITRDITQRKRAEEDLRDSEERYRALVQSANDAIVTADDAGMIVGWNPGAERMFGYGEAEVTGQSLTVLMPDRYRDRHRDGMKRVAGSGDSKVVGATLELEGVRKDGSEFPLEVSISQCEVGGARLLTSIIRDVTQRKRADETLRDSEERYHTLVAHSPDGVFLADLDGSFLSVNEAMCAGLGFSEPELLSMNIWNIVPRQYRDFHEARLARILQGESIEGTAEYEVRTKGGDTRFLEIRSAPFWRKGKVVGFHGIARDITERKRAEETLARQFSTLQGIIESSSSPIFSVDRGFRYTSFNRAHAAAMKALYGTDIGIGRSILDCQTVPEDSGTAGRNLARALAGETLTETEYSGEEGRSRNFFEVVHSPIRDDTGAVMGASVFARDITERKRGEDALRESEVRFHLLAEVAPVGIFQTNEHGATTYVNRRWTEIAGMAAEHAMGFGWLQAVHPEDRDGLAAGWSDASRAGRTSLKDYRFLRPDGTVAWVVGNAVAVSDAGGRIAGYVGTITDITQRRRAEEALRESEARYRQLFASAIDGIAVADAQTGILTDCNETLCSMVGRTREQLIGQSQAILHPPEPLIGAVTADFALGRRETPGKIVETKLLASDGSVRDVEIRATLVDRGGRPHMVGVFRDLTERKKLEREVALRQQRLDSFFQGATAGLALVDEELRFVQVNDTLAEMNGVPAHEHLGRTVREVVPKLAPVVEPLFRRVLTTGEPVLDVEVSGETRSQPGVERHWLQSFFPIAGPTGKPQGVGAIVVEVTEHKHLEAQLRQAHKMEAIGRLAGGVAHDFNNILQAMLSNIALLQLDLRGSGAAAEPLKELDQLVRRAASLTQQLLLFSRRQPAARVLLDLKDAVRGVATLLRRVVRENVAITSELADSPLPVLADRGQLEQVLLNLAINASDAMPGGGTITLRAGAHGDHVFLSLSDTGHGITDEVRAHLFEPFFTTKAPGKGTGLGLSVVHGIVTAHGGRTEVTSAPGEGATFVVWLPRAEALPRELADLTKRPGDLPVGGNEHILVVEDEEGVRKSVTGILRSLGYTVTTAASGEEAGARPAEPAPDLLLTDVVLPGMTGAAVAERLRDRWPALKVVMMSGYLENEALRDLAASGRVYFLQKPFDMHALALTVRQTLDDEAPRVG